MDLKDLPYQADYDQHLGANDNNISISEPWGGFSYRDTLYFLATMIDLVSRPLSHNRRARRVINGLASPHLEIQ